MNSGGTREQLRIRYHRDFDGMVSGAVLAHILQEQGERPLLKSVNYDERAGWDTFEEGRRFALVDFHFHPRAEYWFDHHPTTFLTEELRAQYQPSDRWSWDEESPSCPPLIIRHAQEHFDYRPPDRFMEAAHWSDIIDAARFESVDQAIFGEDPALRLMRALTASPNPAWVDELATALITESLSDVALRADVEKVYGRAARNRDKALDQFPPTVLWNRGGVLFYDAASSKIRRERFAPFYHHPEVSYAVGVIPTRAGFHITCGENPWKQPTNGVHVGEMMEEYGGGGHRAVGGANPPSLAEAKRLGEEVAIRIKDHLASA
ncbi:MAG: hypothetical protein ISQ11_00940 [Planctomycetes bacterium]|nr:hypothetical protein [Planctomycetota bacterium]